MNFLFPKNPKFETLYIEQVAKVGEIAALFTKVAKDFKNFQKYAKMAQKIEEQADNITHNILLELNSAFITPFDREDMYNLAMQIDSIIDHIENVIHSLSIYEIASKNQCIDDFAELFEEGAKDVKALVQLFFEKKHNIEKINKIVIAIHKEEGKGDEVYINAIKNLFKTEKKPIEIIKWKEIIENLERATDKYKDVTDIIVNALMKNG